MIHTWYQTSISHSEKPHISLEADNTTFTFQITIHVHQNENRIMLKVKTGYYLELLTPETESLPRYGDVKITIGKDWENVPKLELAMASFQYNLVIKSY